MHHAAKFEQKGLKGSEQTQHQALRSWESAHVAVGSWEVGHWKLEYGERSSGFAVSNSYFSGLQLAKFNGVIVHL